MLKRAIIVSVSLLFAVRATGATKPPTDHIVIALPELPSDCTYATAQWDQFSCQSLRHLLYLPLTFLGDNTSAQPMVAESWAAINSQSWKVVLRKQLFFANGEAITADDVVATYRQMLRISAKTTNPLQTQDLTSRIDSVERVSTTEVLFKTKGPQPNLPLYLDLPIFPRQALNFVTPMNHHDQGGPFRISKNTATELELVTNEKFLPTSFGMKPISARKILFKKITSGAERVRGLLNGSIDLLQGKLEPEQIKEIHKAHSPSITIAYGNRSTVMALGFNPRNPSLQPAATRQAISQALNIPKIIRLLGLKGIITPPPLLSIEKSMNTTTTVEKAIATKSAFTIKFPLETKEYLFLMKAVTGQLRAAGFDARIEMLDTNLLQKQLAQGEVEVWFTTWRVPPPYQENYLILGEAKEAAAFTLKIQGYRPSADGSFWGLTTLPESLIKSMVIP